MSVSRWLMMLALFFVDVRVRAESLNQDCWGKQIPCAIHSQQQLRELLSGDLTVVMAKNSLLEHREEKLIHLVKGEFYATVNTATKLTTPFAKFVCQEKCKALLERRADEVTIKALEGEWVIQRAGDSKNYTLPSGFQVRISAVQSDGVAQMEFPQSLPWDSTVQQWARFFRSAKSAFKEELARFRQDWKLAVESASQLHANEASRVIASHETDLAKERARRLAIQKEESALRELFRKKNYIDP